ncbi:glucan biosynthesis protein D [Marinomonas ushuaiensis DSM 15871]|uniref:Glucan biosynthesis protein D n=1 Tax=Marinomonas ushuaiensis DSM 15871 TaxID=1122207 RepID=X7E448_9GAMM|nr:glucan biosynthesis protein D [Marinomonas ushuaiensis]ETX09933.1 glucan biosynthesis protein D [Marinomonas ushuaiensis DSM 15871]
MSNYPVIAGRVNDLQRFAGRSLFAVGVLFSMTACATTSSTASQSTASSPSAAQPAEGESFSYAWLKGYARQLATQLYNSHEGELPDDLKRLDWDDYQEIQFDKESSLWAQDDSDFRAGMFHLGLGFDTPVHMNELEGGKSTPIPYSVDAFDYGKSQVDGNALSKDLGFAGFRMQFGTDWQRDVVAFLGASYFRAVGSEMQYGLSARGLAVDTAMPHPEEFPIFTDFWFEKPEPGSDKVTVYALMDSPSVSGAYRFDMSPGEPFKMKVDSAIYPREAIERLGVAPMTSMFMIGENDRRTNYDWRAEIHDSDGLAMQTGNGEWIWRPLSNPEQLQFNSYSDESPKGFGLLQRDRNFDHYQDDGVFYEKRPSLWIEPVGDWGKGSVQLVEIPTLDETFDNIVAFWNPAAPIEAGQELLYSYNMYWGSQPPVRSNRARVVDTFTGIGGVIGKKRNYYSKRFVVDFAGGSLEMLGNDTKVKAVITSSEGRTEIESARPLHSIDGYRAMFDLVPPEGKSKPINLRVYLEVNGQPLTETWLYQWMPPEEEDRELHNAGHLK